MSYQGRNRTVKNKYATANKGKQSITVGEWLERRDFRNSFLANLTDGVMRVFVNGVWLLAEDFDKMYPLPSVVNFDADLTNCDGRGKWMHS